MQAYGRNRGRAHRGGGGHSNLGGLPPAPCWIRPWFFLSNAYYIRWADAIVESKYYVLSISLFLPHTTYVSSLAPVDRPATCGNCALYDG